jgi:hypothetical protein
MTEVAAMPEVEAVTGRLRRVLLQAAFERGRSGRLSARKFRSLLVDLAVEGRDLGTQLSGYLTMLDRLRRIQIVTARSAVFLPLELVYDRAAPDEDARLCPSWAAGGDRCGPWCGSGPHDSTIVCPHAFWGLSRIIERHYISASEGTPGGSYLSLVEPSPTRHQLSVTHATVGASSKVPIAAVKTTLATLDPDARQATTWDDWAEALQTVPSDVLVLMPHTDTQAGTLEISSSILRRGRIGVKHVTGGHDVDPIVMLLGCDTAGSADDPAGFATTFMARKAAVVFASLTMLFNSHAATLAQRLATMLRDPTRDPQPMGDLVRAFRRQAVLDRVLPALSVTAYGDADWTV